MDKPQWRIRMVTVLITLVAIFVFTVGMAVAQGPATKEQIPGSLLNIPLLEGDSTDLRENIKQFIRVLSSEASFELWKQASWTSYPLGPGMHGWLVILSKDGQDIGYMVINATLDGKYQLGEYGIGSSPLFSLTTLYDSLIQQELIPSSNDFLDFLSHYDLHNTRIYINPLHAVWRITLGEEVCFFDAKTGEMLPIMDHDLDMISEKEFDDSPVFSPGLATEHEPYFAEDNWNRMPHTIQVEPFDPYDNIRWLVTDPFEFEHAGILQENIEDGARLVYVSHPFSGTMIKALATIGVQEWNRGEVYVILHEDGPRYISYPLLLQQGKYHIP